MLIFVCRRCDQRLSAEVTEAPLPPPVVEELRGQNGFLPPRMPQGTFAESAELGGLILNPDDVHGTQPHPDPARRNGCCGLDGLDGPNLICAGCGAAIATQQSDCWTQQQVTVLADAVRPVTQRR